MDFRIFFALAVPLFLAFVMFSFFLFGNESNASMSDLIPQQTAKIEVIS